VAVADFLDIDFEPAHEFLDEVTPHQIIYLKAFAVGNWQDAGFYVLPLISDVGPVLHETLRQFAD
jgi:hypothetical protein